MASKYWLKLFHETIYDPKVMMRSPLTGSKMYDRICLVRGLGVLSSKDNASHNLIVLCGLRATLRTPELSDRIPARRVALWL